MDLKRRPRACTTLRRLVERAYLVEPALHEADLVVPVPLHPLRRAERGHNQAEALARVVAAAAGCDVLPNALARTSNATHMRAGAGRVERRDRVRGAFRAVERLVSGRVILVVDDVFTTGATLAACATSLRAAGARDVLALTAARTR